MASAPGDLYTLDDYATLTVETSGATETAVGGITDFTVTTSVEIERLETADSIKVVDQLQHGHRVEVEIEFMFWDGDFAAQWLGGDGSTGTSMADTTSPQEYTLNATLPSRDGSNEISMTVEGITFEEIPLVEASDGEYVSWNLSGTGTDVTTYEVAAPV